MNNSLLKKKPPFEKGRTTILKGVEFKRIRKDKILKKDKSLFKNMIWSDPYGDIRRIRFGNLIGQNLANFVEHK